MGLVSFLLAFVILCSLYFFAVKPHSADKAHQDLYQGVDTSSYKGTIDSAKKAAKQTGSGYDEYNVMGRQ